MPGMQCCAGSTEKSGECRANRPSRKGRAGRPSIVGKSRVGNTG